MAKITIEIADELLSAAKSYAAEHRTSLRALFERGLRAELSGARHRRRPARIRWVTVDGGLPAPIDVVDRVAMIEGLRRQ